MPKFYWTTIDENTKLLNTDVDLDDIEERGKWPIVKKITGVAHIEKVDRYSLVVKKGQVFTWDFVERAVDIVL